MQKKDWAMIIIGALTLAATFVTGLVTIESRVSSLEAKLQERARTQDTIVAHTLEITRQLGRLQGLAEDDPHE